MLEAVGVVVGIATSLVGGLWFLLKQRKAAIESSYKVLAQAWTNEGDINSTEARFITLRIRLSQGDLVGTLSAPKLDRPYEAHIKPGWFSSTLHISQLQGRNLIPVAKVQLRIRGNQNRLHWKLKEGNKQDFLPTNTILWLRSNFFVI